MTNIRRWTRVLLLAVSVLAGSPTTWAQATFSVSSTPSTVIRTGTCRAGGGDNVLDRFRDHGRRDHPNRSQSGRAHQRLRHHFD